MLTGGVRSCGPRLRYDGGMGWVFRIVAMAGIALGASCVESGLVDCGDGTVCPVSYTCVLSGCLSPAQLAACAGRVDGEACSGLTIGDGTCLDGGCVVAHCGNGVVEPGEACDDGNQASEDGCSGSCKSNEGCGNGFTELDEECDCGDPSHPGSSRCAGTSNGGAICTDTCRQRRCGDGAVDPGEVCDDGNAVPGDGCNFDCTSNESCGNGVVDYFVGEQCDDANDLDRDGCATSCREEAYTWQRLTQTATPPARSEAAMTYDAARGRVVLFGGTNGSYLGDTWELDRATWIQRTPATSPPARFAAAIAYDAARGRVVLFGGTNGNNLADTWEFDGATWIQRAPSASPPARKSGVMTYDAARRRVVLFGGRAGGFNYLGDTWEYDGTTWVQRMIASPPERANAVMTYDPKRGLAILFGGANTNGTLNDTWVLDGTAWTVKNTGPGRKFAAMAYDAARDRTVLFGGFPVLGDTWEFDGVNWAQRTTLTTSPSARYAPAMTYDVARGRIIVFGGHNSTNGYFGDTWQLVN